MKKLVPLLVCFVTIISLPSISFTQIVWSKFIRGDAEELGMSVQQTADGGYIIVGNTNANGAGESDIWLLKTDSFGSIKWDKTFGGPNVDFGESVKQTADGGYIIAGATTSYGAGDWDAWIIKTDATGNELWNKTLGDGNKNYIFEIQQTTDGGFIVVGSTGSDTGEMGAWLIKTTSAGNLSWQQKFGGTVNENERFSVKQTSDGGYIIAGNTRASGAGKKDAWLIKTDSSGLTQWDKTFGGIEDDGGASVLQTTDGGYLLTGSTFSYGAGMEDAWLIKTDSNGIQQWQKTFGGNQRDFGTSVHQTIDGGYIFTGATFSSGQPDVQAWLVKTDGNGIEQWIRNLSVPPSTGWDVQQCTDKGYIITGVMGQDLFLIKTDSAGFSTTPEATARKYVNTVIEQAESFAADAQLLYINTPVDIPVNGKAIQWTYFFKSVSQQKLYEFWFMSGDFFKQDTISNENINLNMNPLPDNWIDSDIAIAVAEENGGSDFRTAYSDYRIGATLLPAGPDYAGAVWLIGYGSDFISRGLIILVDAQTGTLYEEPKITAREQLSLVKAAAEAEATDAQLVFLRSHQLDTLGRVEQWSYVFKSLEQQKFYEFKVKGGYVEKIPQLTIVDDRIKLGMPALPEFWIDSDSIMIVVEQNGGRQFRQMNNDYSTFMSFTTFNSAEAGIRRPTWQVSYTSPTDELLVMVDGVVGITYDKFPKTTAREKWASIDSLVKTSNLPTDVLLVDVRSENVDSVGKALLWNYVYESVSQDSLYKFRSFGGQVGFRSPMVLSWLQTGKTAIPDSWIDSDSIIAYTEQNGGKEFRETDSDWKIEMDLQASQDLFIQANWSIYYIRTSGGLEGIPFTINAIPEIPPVWSTAQEKLASVDSAATAIAADAQLIYVHANYVDESGKTDQWIYIYESESKQTRYEFWMFNGQIVQQNELTIVWLRPDLSSFPVFWIDSDSAIAFAERDGGNDFRTSYPDWNLNMNFHAFTEEISTSIRGIWNINYNRPSSSEGLSVSVDAFKNIPDSYKSSARERLYQVNSEAAKLASDAELVWVSSYDLDLNGKSFHWFYIYQSLSQQKLYELWLDHTQVAKATQITLFDTEIILGMTALPDRWADSDTVLVEAEQNGGSQFRAQYNDWWISSRLFTTANDGLQWELLYHSSTNLLPITVDGLTDVDYENQNFEIPSFYKLYQNYPNPFNPTTKIKFFLPKAEKVKIEVFNLLGKKVTILIDDQLPIGFHEVNFNTQDLSSGIYVYKITAGQYKAVKKMLLLK